MNHVSLMLCGYYLLMSFHIFIQAPQVSLKCVDLDCACHLAPPEAPCCCLSKTEKHRAEQSRPDAVPLAELVTHAKCQGAQVSEMGVLLAHSVHLAPPIDREVVQPSCVSALSTVDARGWRLPDPMPAKIPIVVS